MVLGLSTKNTGCKKLTSIQLGLSPPIDDALTPIAISPPPLGGQTFANPALPISLYIAILPTALLASVPKLEERTQRLYSIEGQPPPLFDLPPGCPFAPRCEYAQDVCREAYPVRTQLGGEHTTSCWKTLDFDISKADPDELAAAQSVDVTAALDEESEAAEVEAVAD